MRTHSLLSQVLAVNVLLVTASMFAAAVASRLDLDVVLERNSFLILALAIATTLMVNVIVLRRRFGPLERLIETMEQVDLSAPGVRASRSNADSQEVARLTVAFNRMLARLEGERRSRSTAVLAAQERERQRIAQDLHDEVNQALTAIILRLQASSQDAPPALARELDETRRLAGQAMEELLHLARELRPTALDDHGLLAALRTQVRDFGERTRIESSFTRHGDVPPLTSDQQLVIYRVTQESLSNVVQHANARHVDVVLSFVGRTVLRICDDGRGLPGPRVEPRAGAHGLSGMQERAMLVGGRVAVDSGDGGGTTVTLTL